MPAVRQRSSTNGATITFSSATAAPEVVAALKSQPIDCVAGAYTMKAGSLDIDDEIADQPLLSGGRRKPSCKPLKRTVRGGESIPFRCRGAGRKLGVHIFPLRGRDFFTGTERVRNGRFRVPTTRSMRGKTAISLWIQGTRVRAVRGEGLLSDLSAAAGSRARRTPGRRSTRDGRRACASR
jgi:hypothetical protein